MTITAITRTHTPEQLAAMFPSPEIRWILLKELDETVSHGDQPVDIWLDLDFVHEEDRVMQLSRLLPALVMINAVIPTLRDIGRPFVRINAWAGFAERNIHELVVPDDLMAGRIADIYQRLGHAYRLTPDEPGMISARIIATIINEAWFTWEERVGTKEDIDTAMKLGTNYPRGPFEWGRHIGLEKVVALLKVLSKTDPRYDPAAALQEAVEPPIGASAGLKSD
jgi:3-hydroxybutyryl-CoA dehydrogenase